MAYIDHSILPAVSPSYHPPIDPSSYPLVDPSITPSIIHRFVLTSMMVMVHRSSHLISCVYCSPGTNKPYGQGLGCCWLLPPCYSLVFRYHCVCWHMAYKIWLIRYADYRAYSRFAPSQWETALLCNTVSHWLGASLESGLRLGQKGANLVSNKTSLDLIKPQRQEIGCKNCPIALKFDKCLGSSAAEAPTKFQRDTSIFTPWPFRPKGYCRCLCLSIRP